MDAPPAATKPEDPVRPSASTRAASTRESGGASVDASTDTSVGAWVGPTRAHHTTRSPWRRALGGALRGMLVALLSFATVAAAQRLATRRVGVEWNDRAPLVHFSVKDLAENDAVRGRMESGIAQHLSVTVQAFRRGAATPFLTRQATCVVTYDIFARQYVVRRGRRANVVAAYDQVLDQCLVLRRVPIGDAEAWGDQRGRSVYFAIRAELNPVSPTRCRQILRGSSAGGDSPIGPIVINIVRREICEADRVVEFRSEPIEVP